MFQRVGSASRPQKHTGGSRAVGKLLCIRGSFYSQGSQETRQGTNDDVEASIPWSAETCRGKNGKWPLIIQVVPKRMARAAISQLPKIMASLLLSMPLKPSMNPLRSSNRSTTAAYSCGLGEPQWASSFIRLLLSSSLALVFGKAG
jgi:hypothetical protein